MLLDHAIMCILLVPLLQWASPVPVQPAATSTAAPTYVYLCVFLLYALKDSFRGRSLAKRMLQLQVTDNRRGEPASVLRCFARNLTICIWPVEVLIALLNPRRRLGDYLVGTTVQRIG